MNAEDSFADDPVLRRVAAVRPQLDEADLSPSGDRGQAVLARVLATPEPTGPAWRAARPRLRWPAGVGVLAAGAVAAVLVIVVIGLGGGGSNRSGGTARTRPTLGTHPVPADDAIHLNSTPFIPRKQLKLMLRTPLGRAIAQQYRMIQENVDTGTPAQNRRALEQLQFNQAATKRSAEIVGALKVPPAQRFIQYDWVQGMRLQSREDALLIASLKAFAAGDRAKGRRIQDRAGELGNDADGFGAYAMNSFVPPAGPPPRVPGIKGPKWRGG